VILCCARCRCLALAGGGGESEDDWAGALRILSAVASTHDSLAENQKKMLIKIDRGADYVLVDNNS
jgi:hypothetical protein